LNEFDINTPIDSTYFTMIPAVLFSALVAIAAAAPLDNSRSSVRRPSAASSGPVHLPLVKARAEPGARLRRRQKGKDGSE